jgi:hypothetical protein
VMNENVEVVPGACQAPSPLTLPARGPFGEGSSSKLTRCPSFNESNEPSCTELRWKNHSCPPSSRMNPNPRSLTSLLMVPVGIERPPVEVPTAGTRLDLHGAGQLDATITIRPNGCWGTRRG